MTTRLYYDEPYMTEFEATIVELGSLDESNWVRLDRTAFYPTSGGQPHDTGSIAGLQVVDVIEHGENVLHVVETSQNTEDGQIPGAVGDKVACKIDWERRFDFMQQHGGQHLLSAAFEKTIDADTVGFHLTETSLTIDLDVRSLDERALDDAETLANSIVYKNLPILSQWPSEERLLAMPLRKPPARTEGIRVIVVEGLDWSPCGGTHPATTAEIGMVKITATEKVRSGVRVSFVCGLRALLDFREKNRSIRSVSAMLSVATSGVEAAVKALSEQNTALHKRTEAMAKELVAYEAAALIRKGDSVIEKVYKNRNPAHLRTLALSVTNEPGRIAVLGAHAPSVQVMVARSDDLPHDARNLLEPAKSVLGGRGGGNPRIAQAGGTDASLVDGAVKAVIDALHKNG